MPDWFARMSWESRNKNQLTVISDSPASYVGLLSLCGIVACVALALGLWQRRWVVAAMLVAAGAFAYAAYVSGSYWLGLSRGVMLLDGRLVQDMGSEMTAHWPRALPLFVIAAIAGAISALALTVYWREALRATRCWGARREANCHSRGGKRSTPKMSARI
ncbi:MAG TPA: hypothetical protein VFI12_03535 [Thermomicrobiales bacterium]|jgi:hypothetical protein|nr:hypothetical protein [Thermomicrobiales bacterium]